MDGQDKQDVRFESSNLKLLYPDYPVHPCLNLVSEGSDMEESERLWEADDQRGRLEELTAQAGASKEAPLRRDVRSLGRLLGAVLREQAGGALFDTVEELRSLTSAQRESSDAAERERLMSRAESVVARA